ncbi:MAG: hypothetical protein PHV53_09715 [Fermentimonas sp.]|jgi:GLPGLI family protein|nr:hypothetical protein [Fermentimonas sp.]
MKYQKNIFTSIAILSFLFLSINFQNAKAEEKQDKAFLRIVYAFTQEKITRESMLTRTDTMSLDIGTRYSEFYDMAAFAKDSLKKLFSSQAE